MKLKNILFSFLLVLFFSGNILSHQKSQSYTSWKGEMAGTEFIVSVSTKISKAVLFNQLQNNNFRIDQLEIYFKNKITSEDCFSQNPLIQDKDSNYVRYLNKFVCSTEKPRFNFNLFFDLIPSSSLGSDFIFIQRKIFGLILFFRAIGTKLPLLKILKQQSKLLKC